MTYVPTVDEVAALLPARTYDSNGNEVGTFNANTRPTDTQVEALIPQATDEVLALTGVPTDDSLAEGIVLGVIAVATAMKIELGFFPEQVSTGRSPYDQWAKAFDGMIARAAKAVQAIDEGETPETINEISPVFDFPANDGGMVGWGTRW